MIRRVLLSTLFAIAPGLPLGAQTLVATGDAQVRLGHLLQGHPEGVLLCLPAAGGRSFLQGLTAALDQEAALDLALEAQELTLTQPAGRELQRMKGWNAETPHWALLGPGPRILAEGAELPTAEALREAHRASGLPTRAALLSDFLRTHPDHEEALAQLILELRGPAERRTERLAPPPKEATQPPTLLASEADDRLWGAYADRYEQLLASGAWRRPGGDVGPLPVAAPLTDQAVHSPRLRALAERLLPEVETHLRPRPEDPRRWKVWLSLRAAVPGSRPHEVLAGLPPLPGARTWPPPAALEAFVEDARQQNDWRTVEPLLEEAYRQSLAFLQRMEEAARQDAPGGRPDLGSSFGFGGWTGELALLVEAKLRLARFEEADRIFMAAYGRTPRSKMAEQAAALARECGSEALAAKWERFNRPTP
ncbi:MAG TPA: hypothetical protein VJ505_15665 [Holophagaceae bacterium]|nr:hypothetical protein [Holophagaceae bacterium]